MIKGRWVEVRGKGIVIMMWSMENRARSRQGLVLKDFGRSTRMFWSLEYLNE